MRRQPMMWMALLLSAFLVLTGCGGSGGGSTAMDSMDSMEPPAPTAPSTEDQVAAARAELATAQAARTAAGMDVMAAETAWEMIVAARQKIYDLTQTTDAKELLAAA